MALTEATLATALEDMEPTSSELEAEQTFSESYGTYMKQAIAGAAPIISAAVDSLAVPAMKTAVDFDCGDSCGDCADEMVEGFVAFWGAMVAAPASFFASATAISPPSFTGLAATLAATLADNSSNGYSLADCAAALAEDIHPATDNQGTATFPGPIVETIT